MEKKYYLQIKNKGTHKLEKRKIWWNEDKKIYEIEEFIGNPKEITCLLDNYGITYPHNLYIS